MPQSNLPSEEFAQSIDSDKNGCGDEFDDGFFGTSEEEEEVDEISMMKKKLELQEEEVRDVQSHFSTGVISSDKNMKEMFNCGSNYYPTKCCSAWQLTHYQNLPSWLQVNEHIHDGHRPPLPSITLCLTSIFHLHYDTLNIWSHLLPIFYFSYRLLFNSPSFLPTLQDTIFYNFHLCCIITCLIFSTLFHIFDCHSEKLNLITVKLDYIGISILIYGYVISPIYFINYCHVQTMKTIMTVGTITFAMTLIISLTQYFNGNSRTKLIIRIVVYSLFTTCFIMTGFAQYFIYSYHLRMQDAVIHCFLMILHLIFSLIFLVARIPERFVGSYHYLVHSHGLMHVFVVLAVYHFHWSVYYTAWHQLSADTC